MSKKQKLGKWMTEITKNNAEVFNNKRRQKEFIDRIQEIKKKKTQLIAQTS